MLVDLLYHILSMQLVVTLQVFTPVKQCGKQFLFSWSQQFNGSRKAMKSPSLLNIDAIAIGITDLRSRRNNDDLSGL